MLIESSKMAMIKPMKGDNDQSPIDDAKVKALGGKSLGTKVIDGHPCHGYQYGRDGATIEVWTADDLHIAVDTITNSSNGKEVSHLGKYVPTAPSADMFDVPAGYKTMPMGAAMGGS